MTDQTLQFSSGDARRCWEALSAAAEGHENLAVYEAAGVLIAQAIASGSFTLDDALGRVSSMAIAMGRDMQINWTTVIAQRKAKAS